MRRRYVTVDVFTDRVFGGNPLAVVLDAQQLDSARMQAIAAEFNYSETTFVLPASRPSHDAQVRIFTPRSEMPFAGHPNVGTAVVLAHELQRSGRPVPERFLFEEVAGTVPVRLLRAGGEVVGAELTAPQGLDLGACVTTADAAASLSLAADDIDSEVHAPRVASVGARFLIVALRSAHALERAQPDVTTHRRLLPPLATDAVFAWCRGAEAGQLQARMFAPLDGVVEDPATGIATAAAVAMLARTLAAPDGESQWQVQQGVQMGRPSLLLARVHKRAGEVTAVHVGGRAVPVMSGILQA
ncbi:MAG: PhzF family phenazine biosynthesis protein [Proteobacteria bacterium]|nr:PhzF family phenazine biosynthesis protein [Pseudomonadota bacterium]